MVRIIAAITLSALLGGCVSYTQKTSPCVCNWESINTTGEATI